MKLQHTTVVVCSLIGMALGIPGGPVYAQTPNPIPDNAGIRAAETRLREITTRMSELDASIEQQIQRMADFLAGLKDSPESRSRVAEMKKEFMQNLKKSIDVYQRLRNQRVEQLGRAGPAGATKDTEQSLDILDGKIDTRVEQIVQVAHSFSESDGMRDYHYVYDYDGFTDEVETDASRQARREDSRTGQVEEKVIRGLEAAIRDEENRKRTLQDRLRWAATDAQKADLQNELATVDVNINTRRQQIADLIREGGAAQQTVGSREAFALDQQLDEQLQQLKKMFQELYTLAAERRNEVQRLRAMRMMR